MSEIRVNKIQGTSGTDTALSGANATVGGTLAVQVYILLVIMQLSPPKVAQLHVSQVC